MKIHIESQPPPPPPDDDNDDDAARLEDEVAALEARLAAARERLRGARGRGATTTAAVAAAAAGSGRSVTSLPTRPASPPPPPSDDDTTSATTTQHFLLLLADSALPLGSFAFSSGLESYLAHERRAATTTTTGGRGPRKPASFSDDFFPLSLSSYAATALPFVLAAHRDPGALPDLDDALDAAVACPVGRRASIAQGRALLGIWERSLAGGVPAPAPGVAVPAFKALLQLSASSASSSSSSAAAAADDDDLPPPYAGHLPPLFGAVARLLGLPARQTAHVFLLGHAKALASAGVRAGVLGPYQAQRVLARAATRDQVAALVAREWAVAPEAAGQRVPAMDLWAGRHELLYSRIFNS